MTIRQSGRCAPSDENINYQDIHIEGNERGRIVYTEEFQERFWREGEGPPTGGNFTLCEHIHSS